MPEYRCFKFSPARARAETARLAPPLSLLPQWSLRSVAYPPLVSGGKVFVSFLQGEVRAFDEETAAELWRVRFKEKFTPLPPHNGALLLAGDTLLVRVGHNLLHLDPRQGTMLDHRPIPLLDLWGGVLVEDHILSEFENDELLCGAWDLETGALSWQRPWEGSTWYATAAGGVLCLSPQRGSLSGLAVSTGEVLWTVSFAELGEYRELDGAPRKGYPSGVPVALQDSFIVPVTGHHVVALDARTGHESWRRRIDCLMPGNLASYPDGRLYVFDYRRYYCLEARTGRIVFEIEVEDELVRKHGLSIFTDMDVADGYLYCSDIGGVLFAMHKESGRIHWTYRTGSKIPAGNPPVVVGDRLYLVDAPGNLFVFGGGT